MFIRKNVGGIEYGDNIDDFLIDEDKNLRYLREKEDREEMEVDRESVFKRRKVSGIFRVVSIVVVVFSDF